MDDKLIQRAAKDILNSKRTIAFTGAGISVESGIPDFRGAQGLWQKYDPEEYAHIHTFHSDPDRVWLMLKEMFSLIMEAKPNPAHLGLAELERMGYLSSVITQNVDGLHQAAGSRNVIEFHGTHRTLSCLKCSLHRRWGFTQNGGSPSSMFPVFIAFETRCRLFWRTDPLGGSGVVI